MSKAQGSKNSNSNPYSNLQPYDQETGALRAVIESPMGCKNKYKFTSETGLFELHKVLPSGMFFPLDFGFVPSTLADDGDPIDILVFTDQPTFTGCVIKARLIGVIQAEQKAPSEKAFKKNHRLLGVSVVSHAHQRVETIDDVEQSLIQELEHFFVSYNDAQNKKFNILGRGGPDVAKNLLDESITNKG